MIPKISILTPTIRKEALELITHSLRHQIYTDYEWIIGSSFNPEVEVDNFSWVKDDFEGGFWSLNRIYNKMFKKARGELIVSWQDSIWVPPEGLKKFWDAYQEKKTIISGVGDQYSSLDEYGKPIIKVWSDPRKTDKYGNFYKCYWNDAEWNWCAFPKKFIYEIGGMDEELDFKGYGGDQLQVCERWEALRKDFWIDQTNESYTLSHGRSKGWEKNHVLNNGEYDKRKEELKKSGKWPYLDFLK